MQYNPSMPRCVALVSALLSPALALACARPAAEGDETGATGTGETDELGSLIDHQQWQVLDAAADPLADHRPVSVDCGSAGWLYEATTLEVRTVAPEPALGHVAIMIDGQMLWEQEIAIPGDANVFIEEFASPITAELGSQVVFHLHNHGPNAWVLQDLQTMP
jgi:hypothetical protein